MNIAHVAQRIEHLASDQGVGGSSPSGRTKYLLKTKTYAILANTTEVHQLVFKNAGVV